MLWPVAGLLAGSRVMSMSFTALPVATFQTDGHGRGPTGGALFVFAALLDQVVQVGGPDELPSPTRQTSDLAPIFVLPAVNRRRQGRRSGAALPITARSSARLRRQDMSPLAALTL